MGYMQGTTFRTSPTDRMRRRTDGPTLTLIRGADNGSRTSIRDDRPSHPAQDGFTPDGLPSDSRDSAVHDSEPGPSPFTTSSRGSSTLDQVKVTSTGSGPINYRGQLLQLVAEFLEQHAGDDDTVSQFRAAPHPR